MAYDLPLIWQDPLWPQFQFDAQRVGVAAARARHAQGAVEGRLAALGFEQRLILEVEAWSQDAVATAAIEGERYDLAAVRSSIARRLGVAAPAGPRASHDVEGLLDVMEDAVRQGDQPLTHERLKAWQAALFPPELPGWRRVLTGEYRSHEEPMQVVSGGIGHEKVHYEAPPSSRVPLEMQAFITWFNAPKDQDPLVTAALAHLWFEAIHPFEDGNGRVGRVLIDLMLARVSGTSSRLILTSKRLLEKRQNYYDELQAAQHASLDATRWVLWFLDQIHASCERASMVVDATLAKARFWLEHSCLALSTRQRKVLNVLLDAGPGGFQGGMSTRKYESIASTSRGTAARELQELETLGLVKRVGAGRSTRYYVAIEGWDLVDGEGPAST